MNIIKKYHILFLFSLFLLSFLSGCTCKMQKEKESKPGIRKYDGIIERDISFRSQDGVIINGTITEPSFINPISAVVMLSGSGPNDRDESIGPNKPFFQIAHGLAKNGILSLRFDKRTYTYLDSPNSPEFTFSEEYLFDAVSAIDYLKGYYISIAKIYVLGHSLGSTAAIIVANNRKVNGLILLGLNYSSYFDTVIRQYYHKLASNNSSESIQEINYIIKGFKEMKKQIEDGNTNFNFAGINGAYWMSLSKCEKDRMFILTHINIPIFILQGDNDWQSSLNDFYEWEIYLYHMNNIKFKLYPKLNHFFSYYEGKSDGKEYSSKSDISDAMMNDIVQFIKTN